MNYFATIFSKIGTKSNNLKLILILLTINGIDNEPNLKLMKLLMYFCN